MTWAAVAIIDTSRELNMYRVKGTQELATSWVS